MIGLDDDDDDDDDDDGDDDDDDDKKSNYYYPCATIAVGTFTKMTHSAERICRDVLEYNPSLCS